MRSIPAPDADDLRTGRTVWEFDEPEPSSHVMAPPFSRADVLIVGAGITGAFLADKLTREGRSVIVIDRHAPQRASTAASTALLLWEIDAPMLELEDRLGFDIAAAIYRRSFEAVRAIAQRLGDLAPACRFTARPTLYLAGDDLDASDLREECRIRAHADLPTAALDTDSLYLGFGIERDAALLSLGAAEADPVRLARLLLDSAIARGARVYAPATAQDYDHGADGVTITLADGAVCAGDMVVLANGFEMPPFLEAPRHRISSTWAVATRPQTQGALWPERALLWEASTPYLYARTTLDGRILIGGCDEEMDDADAREALIPSKSETLRAKIARFAKHADTRLDAAWTGAFGETDDSLPIIGRVPGHARCHAAFGYGGNGITFSAMAADIIATLMTGGSDPAADWFAVDR